MKLKLSIVILLSTFLFSCEKDKEIILNNNTPFSADSGSVYISCEGNFQSANASITYFNPDSAFVNDNIYRLVNGAELGDVCQSMKYINGKIYAVVNNSGKIVVCNARTLHKMTTISGLTSPRYIQEIDSTKAYVTDTYSNNVSIINLVSNTISGSIPLNGWTEQMLLKNNKIYVTNPSSDYLYVIDPSNDIVSDSIQISKGAVSILEDKNGKLWVLCSGDYMLTYDGALYRIDPLTKQIELNAPFQPNEYPSKLCINATNDTMYFLNTNVWRMSIDENSLPGTSFIPSSGNNFYGLAVDKQRNQIYVSDAIDFIQKGSVFRYNADGSAIDNFKAGINPSDFLFLPY